jgi:hypothetical protein
MDLKRIARDTAKTLTSYLTYQAVRVVLDQLRETDPPKAFWLNRFSTQSRIQDGEAYLQALLRENQALAFRVMTVRAHLAEEIADFLPEMVRSDIGQANIEHRREYLERITQLSSANPSVNIEPANPEAAPESESDSEPS